MPAVLDVERLPVVSPPLALLARHVDVGQEVHLDRDHPVALTGLTSSALDVEGEAPRPEPTRLGLRHHREQLADEREHAGVGGGIRPRRSSDRRLIDFDDLVDERDAVDAIVRARLGGRPIDRLGQRSVQDVVHERRLARAAHTSHCRQGAERNGHVDVLQVVRARAADDDLALRCGASGGRSRNRALAAQVRAGERPMPVRKQLRRLALEDDVSAMLAGARSQVHDVVGGANRFFVVLHDNDGVSQVAKTGQRRQQAPIVALVQANRRLVEHVEDAGEVGADLRRQPDALSFTAGQRGGASIERQVSDADVIEESQALANLSQHPPGHECFTLAQLKGLEHGQHVADREIDVIRHAATLDLDREALRLQPLAVADGALAKRPIRLEVLLNGPRSLFVPSSQIGNHALEVATERIGIRRRLADDRRRGSSNSSSSSSSSSAATRARFGGDLVLFGGSRRPEEHQLPMLARQLAEGRVGVEAVGARQRRHRLPHELAVAADPRGNRTAEQRQRLVGHNEPRVEVVGRAQDPDMRDTRHAAS